MRIFFLFILFSFQFSSFSQSLNPKKDIAKCLFGYIDNNENWKIEPKFEQAWPFENNFALVNYDGLVGVIDTNGNYIISPEYQQIKKTENNNFTQTRYIASKNNQDYIFNQNHELLTLKGFPSIRQIPYSPYFLYTNNKKEPIWGILDNYGKIISPEIFPNEKIYQYSFDSLGIFQFKIDNLWGLYDTKSKSIIIEAKYKSIRGTSNQFFVALKESSSENQNNRNSYEFWLLDANGKYESSVFYDTIYTTRYFSNNNYPYPENNDILILRKDGKFAIYSEKISIKNLIWWNEMPKYIGSNNYIVKKENNYGVYNLNEKIILPTDFQEIWFSKNYILCKKKNLWSFYSNNFKRLTRFKYQKVEFSLDSNIVNVINSKSELKQVNPKTGIETNLDFTKTNIIQLKDKQVVRIAFEGKYGYYNLDGKMILPPGYNYLPEYFSAEDTIGIYSTINGCGLISNSLKIIMPTKFDTIIEAIDSKYDEVIFWTLKGGKWGMLNKNGLEILEPKYGVPYVTEDYWQNYVDNCDFTFSSPIIMGFIDQSDILFDSRKGIISQTEMQQIISTKDPNKFVFQSSNKKFGYIDGTGKVYIPPISDFIPYIFSDDSVLIYSNNHYYFYNLPKNILLDKPLSEYEIKLIILKIYKTGAFNLNIDFDEEILQEIKNQFILNSLFDSYSADYSIENYFELLGRYLSGFESNDYCNIECCYRSLNEINESENYCWPPGYGTFEETNYYLNQISESDFMLNINRITYGHGSGDVSNFYFYHYEMNEIKPFYLNQSIKNLEEFYSKLSKIAINSEVIKEMSNEIDCSKVNEFINQDTEISIDSNGLHVWIDYWEMGPYQIDVLIPWEIVKPFVIENSKLANIIEYDLKNSKN